MINAVTVLRQTDPSESRPGARALQLRTELVAGKKRGKGAMIMLPTMEGSCFEKIKHIAYLEASGNYTVLHFVDARQVLVCKTLREVEQMLPGEAFVRIHRSHTIHLRHIKKYVRGKGGYVVLNTGATLTVSVGQKEAFLDTLKLYFG